MVSAIGLIENNSNNAYDDAPVSAIVITNNDNDPGEISNSLMLFVSSANNSSVPYELGINNYVELVRAIYGGSHNMD